MEDDDDLFRDYRKEPIYIKARELAHLALQVADIIDHEKDNMLDEISRCLREDAVMIPAKVARAIGSTLYDSKMECATLVRKSANDLQLQCTSLEMFGFTESQYLDLIRAEVEEFRELFIDWVAAFDPWDYRIDRWGLFNPPGVGARDKDPDDDIPND